MKTVRVVVAVNAEHLDVALGAAGELFCATEQVGPVTAGVAVLSFNFIYPAVENPLRIANESRGRVHASLLRHNVSFADLTELAPSPTSTRPEATE